MPAGSSCRSRSSFTCSPHKGGTIHLLLSRPCSGFATEPLASYPRAIQRLQREGHLGHEVEHRTSKYLNNVIEADHGALKRVIRPTRGFQRMTTAYATLKGFEVMRMIRRGHCVLREAGAKGEIRLVNQSFGLAA
jgi:transposase, IS6 family